MKIIAVIYKIITRFSLYGKVKRNCGSCAFQSWHASRERKIKAVVIQGYKTGINSSCTSYCNIFSPCKNENQIQNTFIQFMLQYALLIVEKFYFRLRKISIENDPARNIMRIFKNLFTIQFYLYH